ncbi:LutC/YkgG family protein [Brevibacillus formosus]|uniref:LutC/YkgG family protein n=1 Tax=Brevibacillus formosus TaxID=54913 RepID=UPI003F1ADAA8
MSHSEKEAQFFNTIANRLGRSRMTTPPPQPVRGVPDFWKMYNLSSDERIDLFIKNWEMLGGVAKRFSSPEALCSYIAEVVQTFEAKRIIHEDHALFQSMYQDRSFNGVEMTIWRKQEESDLLSKAAHAEIGISIADFAIAHTGTVVMTSAASKGRSLSLLPTIFMAVIRTENIKTRMGEALQEINKWNDGKMPAGVHFISGPSRSADIENDLTIGVHGPGIVHALILEEETKG